MPDEARQYLSTLGSTYIEKKAIEEKYIKSIAQPDKAFTKKPGIFKRFRAWLWHETKTVTVNGKDLGVPISLYDKKSNIAAVRSLFLTALGGQIKVSIGRQEHSPDIKKVCSFVLTLEKDVKVDNENGSCREILCKSLLESVNSQTTATSLESLLQSDECQALFEVDDEKSIDLLLKGLLDKLPSKRADVLGLVYKYSPENRKRYVRFLAKQTIENLQVDLSKPEGLQQIATDLDTLKKYNLDVGSASSRYFLDRVGMLQNQWKEELRKYNGVLDSEKDPAEFKKKFDKYHDKIVDLMTDEITKFEKAASSLPVEKRVALSTSLIRGQMRLLWEFLSPNIERGLNAITTRGLKEEEAVAVYDWLQKILQFLESVRKQEPSPNELIDKNIKLINEKIVEVSKNISSETVKKVKGGLVWIAAKTADAAKGVFFSLPAIVTVVMPTVLAAKAGYQAAGMTGLALSAGTALTTSCVMPLIASGVGKMTKGGFLLSGAPPSVASGAGVIARCATQIVSMYLLLEWNNYIAGTIHGAFATVKKPEEKLEEVRPEGVSKEAWNGICKARTSFNFETNTAQEPSSFAGMSKEAQGAYEATVSRLKMCNGFFNMVWNLFSKDPPAPVGVSPEAWKEQQTVVEGMCEVMNDPIIAASRLVVKTISKVTPQPVIETGKSWLQTGHKAVETAEKAESAVVAHVTYVKESLQAGQGWRDIPLGEGSIVERTTNAFNQQITANTEAYYAGASASEAAITGAHAGLSLYNSVVNTITLPIRLFTG